MRSAGPPPVRYGLLGTGSIAAEFARSLGLAKACAAEVVASRDVERARTFAARYGVRRAAAGYEAVLADPDVDVVYVATPHSEHARWTSAAIRAGKAVLCEKPLTVNESQALKVIGEASARGAALLEGFAYRFHPQTTALLGLIGEGAVGSVSAIDITFSFDATASFGLGHRLTTNALAGGGILDVGCYCTSMSSLIVATAMGSATAEPLDVLGLARLDPVEQTDLYAMAVMRFAGDIIVQIACGVALEQDDHIRIYGSGGSIHVSQPCWLAGRRDAPSVIDVRGTHPRAGAIEIPGGHDIFALEADGFASMLNGDHAEFRTSWEETLVNMRTLDRWRRAVGVQYDCDR